MPAVAFFLKQVWMHIGVFVDTEGEMVTKRQRRIDLAYRVGGKVQHIHQPVREEQANRVAELETELSAFRTHVDQVAQIEGYFERFKHEINTLLERSETQRQQAMRDNDRVRQIEIENVTQAINEFRKEIETFRPYDEELVLFRADIQRLGESIARLQQQILDTNKGQDERSRGIG